MTIDDSDIHDANERFKDAYLRNLRALEPGGHPNPPGAIVSDSDKEAADLSGALYFTNGISRYQDYGVLGDLYGLPSGLFSFLDDLPGDPALTRIERDGELTRLPTETEESRRFSTIQHLIQDEGIQSWTGKAHSSFSGYITNFHESLYSQQMLASALTTYANVFKRLLENIKRDAIDMIDTGINTFNETLSDAANLILETAKTVVSAIGPQKPGNLKDAATLIFNAFETTRTSAEKTHRKRDDSRELHQTGSGSSKRQGCARQAREKCRECRNSARIRNGRDHEGNRRKCLWAQFSIQNHPRRAD